MAESYTRPHAWAMSQLGTRTALEIDTALRDMGHERLTELTAEECVALVDSFRAACCVCGDYKIASGRSATSQCAHKLRVCRRCYHDPEARAKARGMQAVKEGKT